MSPYSNLPPKAFWRSGVQNTLPTDMRGIYEKKFDIRPTDQIATAGSCFAQHIARHLRANGFSVLDAEPPPHGMSDEDARLFGYKIYSARFGNIYTARQLRQLVHEASGKYAPSEVVWEKGKRFFDAQRPSVEPEGLESSEEVQAHREGHLRALRALFKQIDILVFTFGLTEAWTDAHGDTVFPVAPGTIAGSFDPQRYNFRNFGFEDVRTDFLEARRVLKLIKPEMKFLITVSPVPLTATATGHHVLTATTYSKAVLRAVAGSLAAEFSDIDYFPSYEIITNPAARSNFYASNLRTVESEGVESVMRVFFSEHANGLPSETSQPTIEPMSPPPPADDEEHDVVCEEMLLDAFAPR